MTGRGCNHTVQINYLLTVFKLPKVYGAIVFKPKVMRTLEIAVRWEAGMQPSDLPEPTSKPNRCRNISVSLTVEMGRSSALVVKAWRVVETWTVAEAWTVVEIT